MEYLVVIPARYASSRLLGKPLVQIAGLPMIVRTFLQCRKAVEAERIIVATDDQRIGEVCDEHNINWVMTSEQCLTGTDRIAEVARKINVPCYINVQGDEPIFNPDDITKLIDAAERQPRTVICGRTPITDTDDYRSPACPKVVTSLDGSLIYMSRAPIPGNKEGVLVKAWRQVCAYAFPRELLLSYADFAAKTPIEQIEDIEILRFLELGNKVQMIDMSDVSVPVDFPGDVEKVEARLRQASIQ